MSSLAVTGLIYSLNLFRKGISFIYKTLNRVTSYPAPTLVHLLTDKDSSDKDVILLGIRHIWYFWSDLGGYSRK